MSKVIDSQALSVLQKALGLTGVGAQLTELMDSTVEQVLDITPVVRRGRTLAASQGIFRGVLRLTHTDAEDQQATWTPYTEVATNVVAPYITPVPEQFDIWLLSASLRRNSGTGTISAGLELTNTRQGFGIDDGGAFFANNSTMPLAYWDTLVVTATQTFGVTGGAEHREPWKKIMLRIPREANAAGQNVGIRFGNTSSATSVYHCVILFGIFPVSLGQDALL